MINAKPFKRYFSKLIPGSYAKTSIKSNLLFPRHLKTFTNNFTKETFPNDIKGNAPSEKIKGEKIIIPSIAVSLDEMYVEHPHDIINLTGFLNNDSYERSKVYSVNY